MCTPGYLLGRLGILLLCSHRLLVVGIVLLVVGLTVQAGTTGAVKAIKMSAKLLTGRAAQITYPARRRASRAARVPGR